MGDENESVLPQSSTTQTTNEPNENVNSSSKSTAQNSDLKLAKRSEKSSGSESECIVQSEVPNPQHKTLILNWPNYLRKVVVQRVNASFNLKKVIQTWKRELLRLQH